MLRSRALRKLPDGNFWRSLARGGAPELSARCSREWLTHKLDLPTKEYLRADRLAPRRSNSHSPTLRRTPSLPPPHAVAAAQETMMGSRCRKSAIDRSYDGTERSGLPTATADPGQRGLCGNRCSAGVQFKGSGPSRAIGAYGRRASAALGVALAPEDGVATTSERRELPFRQFSKRDCGREGPDPLNCSPALPRSSKDYPRLRGFDQVAQRHVAAALAPGFVHLRGDGVHRR